MKTNVQSRCSVRTLATILAALAAFWAGPHAYAGAEAQLRGLNLIEIRSTDARRPWVLKYGTSPDLVTYYRVRATHQELLIPAGDSRAYFVHGQWLRLIDTENGLVVGRWHFPGEIARLTPNGNQAEIEVVDWLERDQPIRRTLRFDPSSPVVPYWSSGNFGAYRLSRRETKWDLTRDPLNVNLKRTAAEQARQWIHEYEEMVRRDPTAPWLAIALANLLRNAGDARAPAAFQQALEIRSTDFTELLPISAFLERIGEGQMAGRFWERGYRDFLERGNDPRLLIALIDRLILYHPWQGPEPPPADRNEVLLERTYSLAPGAEAAPTAWEAYAGWLERNGRSDAARVWKQRAEEARRISLYPGFPMFTRTADRGMLVVLASVLAALFYLLVLYLRYRPQARLDLLARERARAQAGIAPRERSPLARASTWLLALGIAAATWLVVYAILPADMSRKERVLIPLLFLALPAGGTSVLVRWVRSWWQRRHEAQPAAPGGRASLLNAVYWSSAERVAFLIIVVAGWLAAGYIGGIFRGVERLLAMPLSLAGGSFAGPVNITYLEARMPDTPDRDLLLGLAHQQGGDTAKAERLYRQTPQFAESWNNLGVLLRKAGKEQEAREAFERALKLDPGLPEAALNLGRPARNFWVQIHEKYVPGQPMLAPPRPEQFTRALLGGAWWKVYAGSLAGPLLIIGSGLGHLVAGWGAFYLCIFMLFPLLAAAIALLFVVPSRDVTQAPSRRHAIFEALFPGTSPAWGFLGGATLLAWSYFLLQLLLVFKQRTPYLLTYMWAPNITRAYMVPQASFPEMFNPSWFWLYATLPALFLLNLALLLARRHRDSVPM